MVLHDRQDLAEDHAEQQGDQVETLDTSGISEARVVEVVCTRGGLTLLTSSGELWISDLPDPSLHLLTPGLLGRRVTQVSGGRHHLAAVTDQGQVFTWAEDHVSPVQVAAMMTHHVVQVACGHSSEPQTLALTDTGSVYSWVGVCRSDDDDSDDVEDYNNDDDAGL